MLRRASGSLVVALLTCACSTGGETPSPSSSQSTCEDLGACCETLQDDDRSACEQNLEQAAGDESTCYASLDALLQAGMCGVASSEGGSGGSAGGADDAGPPPICTAAMPGKYSSGPRPWTLPTARCGVEFDSLARSGAVSYSTFALTGDRLPDLVIHSDECDPSVGTDHWDVYSGTDSGFEAVPRQTRIPSSRCGKVFDGPTGFGPVSYSLVDLDGDRLPEIVVTHDDCDVEVGTKHWDLYRFDGEDFSQAPSAFHLPSARCGVSYDQLAAAGAVEYRVVDITGDGRADLVVTRDDCDQAVGVDHWDLYEGTGSGFADVPKAYGLPAGRCGADWSRVSESWGEVAYSLMDLSWDGRPDLVVVSDGCDEEVGRGRWDVYPGGDTAFAGVPKGYGLPTARCGGKWNDFAGADPVTFSLVDLSCDARPELVITEDSCDDEVGTTRWEVYEAGLDSFAATPVSLGLPQGRCGARFDTLAQSGKVEFATVELRGKGRVDLVVTRDDCDPDIGKVRWDVYGLE